MVKSLFITNRLLNENQKLYKASVKADANVVL